MAVVAALELEHAVAVRERPREPERRHRRLGPRRDEPHALDRRDRVDDLGGELDLALGRRAEARPVERGARAPPRPSPDRRGRRAAAPTTAPSRAACGRRSSRGTRRAPRATKNGSSSPTARIARTGELTPPGIRLWARCQSSRPRLEPGGELLRPVRDDTSAPARRIAVSVSSAAARSSTSPAAAAAFTSAYSPETLNAASGRSNRSRTARITSRYGSAGFTITHVRALGDVELALAQRLADVARDPSGSRAGRRTTGAEPAASRNGP